LLASYLDLRESICSLSLVYLQQDSDSEDIKDNVGAITKFEPEPSAPKGTVDRNLFKGAVKLNRELAIVVPETGGRDVLDVFKEVDDLFLKLADSAEKVSHILETKKVHYHSSFSESLRGEERSLVELLSGD
jgi:hypothetical protein